jgi:hypothetical protein
MERQKYLTLLAVAAGVLLIGTAFVYSKHSKPDLPLDMPSDPSEMNATSTDASFTFPPHVSEDDRDHGCLATREKEGSTFKPGERYGDFIFDNVEDSNACFSAYYFVGTTTVTGVYGRSGFSGAPYFEIAKSDLNKVPTEESFWEVEALDVLLPENGFDELGTATLVIADPVIAQVFLGTDAYPPSTFELVKIVSKSPKP